MSLLMTSRGCLYGMRHSLCTLLQVLVMWKLTSPYNVNRLDSCRAKTSNSTFFAVFNDAVGVKCTNHAFRHASSLTLHVLKVTFLLIDDLRQQNLFFMFNVCTSMESGVSRARCPDVIGSEKVGLSRRWFTHFLACIRVLHILSVYSPHICLYTQTSESTVLILELSR